MNILLLGSQHGNELLGDKLHRHIVGHFPGLLPHVTFKIANPKAHAAGKRFIESDMNRSYGPALSTYEAKRASHIKNYVVKHAFDLVLDLHTTACVQPPCFIVEEIYDETRPFLKASSIDKIILMRHEIVRQSLIGHVRQAVSIEVSNDDIDAALLDGLCHDLQRYVDGKMVAAARATYAVTSPLLKSEVTSAQAKKLQNFALSPLGFVPLLVGENSYKKNTDYLGFKAGKETVIRL